MEKELLNGQLNRSVNILFNKMIKAYDKIVDVADGEIKYDNGVSLMAFRKRSDEEIKPNEVLSLDKNTFSHPSSYYLWDVVTPDTDKLIFYIKTPYRIYTVPEIMDRVEYAKVLNTLEESLRQFEKNKMSEYLQHFDIE